MIYQRIEHEFGEYIIEKNILVLVNYIRFTRNHLTKSRSRAIQQEPNHTAITISHKEAKILKAISQNARENIVNIANQVHLSTDIVSYSLKKFKENGLINNFTIQLDLHKLGFEHYQVLFHTQNLGEKIQNDITQFALTQNSILCMGKTIGNYDFFIIFVVRDYRELEQCLRVFCQNFTEQMRDYEILRLASIQKSDDFHFDIDIFSERPMAVDASEEYY